MGEFPYKSLETTADSFTLKSTSLYHELSTDADKQGAVDATPLPACFGRYRRDSFIGRGGFGEVWRAFDPDLDCYVAIKTPRTDRRFPERVIEDFLTEARKLATLRDCPGVMTVFDVGNENGFAYIVSELLEGGCLETVLRRRPLPRDDAVRLLAHIAESLHQAHLKGLVHRDLKPANILLTKNGVPTIVDFGLAVNEEEQLGETRGKLGTRAYMSPEQAAGHSRHANSQSDIYSLGVMLYVMLTQRLPFVANHWQEYREQLLLRAPRPLRTIDNHISPQLERICLKCLAKNPEDRYTTAADLARELRASLVQQEPRRSRLGGLLAIFAAFPIAVTAAVMAIPSVRDSVKPPAAPQHAARPISPPRERPRLPTAADPPRGLSRLSPAEPVQHPPEPRLLPLGHPRRGTLVETRWTMQMRQGPQELIWPGYRGKSAHGFDEQDSVFVVTSDHIRLYEMAEIPETDCQVSIDLHQPIHTGGFGIFLGYHVAPVNGMDQARFQLIRLVPVRVRDGRIVYHVKREKAGIWPSSGKLFIEKEFGYQPVSSAWMNGPTRVRIQIKNRQIFSVVWGKTELTKLVSPEIEQHLDSTDYANWGIFHEAGTTWVAKPLQTPRPPSKTH